ncbi:MAG: vWA domain-containing protein [Bacteroidia bacterium]|nr:vWA domain-containing protein [Bacteroidia bacterium]
MNLYRFYSQRLSIVVILFLASFSARAITIDTPSLPNAAVGSPYTTTITATIAGAEVNACWTVTSQPPWITMITGNGAAFPACVGANRYPGTQLTITGVPPTAGSFTLELNVRAYDAANNPLGLVSRTYSIVVTTVAPVRVMMSLDRSGSMYGLIPGISATGLADNSKWSALKLVANDFIQAFDNVRNEAGDQMGIHFFDDTHLSMQSLSSFGLTSGLHTTNYTSPPAGTLLNFMNANPPFGFTCIGGAIRKAHEQIPSGGRGNVIVFSDGAQNTDPAINAAGTQIVNTLFGVNGTGFTGAALPLNLSALSGNIPIHTIHLGDVGGAAIMNLVSTTTGGQHFSIQNDGDFDSFLAMWDNTLVNNLQGNSPTLGGVRTGKLPNGGVATDMFTVDNKAEILVFKLVHFGTGRMRVTIKKGGVTVIDQVQGPLTGIYTITPSLLAKKGITDIGGNWEVSHDGTPRNYYLSLFIEEETLKFNALIGNRMHQPGDTVPLRVDLIYNEGTYSSLIPDADSVYVILAKPGQDFNDLFAQAVIDLPIEPLEKNLPAGQLKYDALIASNTTFLQAIKPQNRRILLQNNGDGTYTAPFSDTELSGNYQFLFVIKGKHPQLGEYHRVQLVSTVIDFGVADPGKTIFQIQALDRGNILVITPVNKFGHKIGPNRLSQISVSVAGKPLILVDKLDGTYEAQLPATVTGLEQVKVDIKGATFYDDKLVKIQGAPVGNILDQIQQWLEAHGLPGWLIWVILLLLIVIVVVWRRIRRNN